MKEKEFLILQKPNSTGILLEGAAKRLTIKKDDPDFHLAWTRINNFINKNKGHYIYGYLGFDLHAINQPNLKLSTQPAAEFFVAKTKQDFTNPKEVISGNFRGCKKLNLKKYLDNDKEHFIKHTKDTIDWVQKVQGRKLTIARKITFTEKLKPETILFDKSAAPKVSRTFYLKSSGFKIAGRSPELLALGNNHSFKTFKLSGTIPKIFNDAFKVSNKVDEEHSLSIKSQEGSLSKLGTVTHTAPKILELDNLYHLMSIFETKPKKGVGIGTCLKETLPSGAIPYRDGLKFLAETESTGRGAYYGLIGFIDPYGNFEFSQILRSYFIKNNKAHAWVGADITKDSSPEDEFIETGYKLKNLPKIMVEPD